MILIVFFFCIYSLNAAERMKLPIHQDESAALRLHSIKEAVESGKMEVFHGEFNSLLESFKQKIERNMNRSRLLDDEHSNFLVECKTIEEILDLLIFAMLPPQRSSSYVLQIRRNKFLASRPDYQMGKFAQLHDFAGLIKVSCQGIADELHPLHDFAKRKSRLWKGVDIVHYRILPALIGLLCIYYFIIGPAIGKDIRVILHELASTTAIPLYAVIGMFTIMQVAKWLFFGCGPWGNDAIAIAENIDYDIYLLNGFIDQLSSSITSPRIVFNKPIPEKNDRD